MVSDEQGKPSQAEQEQIDGFKRKLVEGSGVLIPLGKSGPNGEKLFLTSRLLLVSDERVDDPRLTWEYMDFSDYTMKEVEIDSILYLDLYADDGNGLFPIGHIDWFKAGELAKDSAVERQRETVISTNKHEEASSRAWKGDPIPFRVYPEFGKMGLGTLLIAASAIVLEANGAKTFAQTSLVTESSKSTVGKYVKFNKERRHVSLKSGPINTFLENQQVDQVIKDFAISDT